MKNIKIFRIVNSLLFILMFLYNPVHAQESNEKSILWSITRSDLSTVSYIFGTHHLISRSLIDTSRILNDIIKNSKVVICELDDEPIDTQLIIRYSLMGENNSYFFSDSVEKSMVEQYVKNEINVDFDDLKKFKPILILTLLQITHQMKMDSNLSELRKEGTDDYFMKSARKWGKELIGLETPDEQASFLFNEIPINVQLAALVEYIKNESKYKSELYNLDSCYKNFDMDCLSQEDYLLNWKGPYKEALLDNRNKRWMPDLIKNINNKPVIIAVGLAHLTGENSVIDLLRKQGYVLTPIKLK